MTKTTCPTCGANAEITRTNYKFAESGLRNVVLQGIELIRCNACGTEDPIIPRVNELMRVLALAIIEKPYRLEGEEVRYLRKYLNKSGEEFSKLLKIDKSTLSKWENGEDPVGKQSDLLIRALALGLGEGLRQELEASFRRFESISASRKRLKIEVTPGRKQPKSARPYFEYKYA